MTFDDVVGSDCSLRFWSFNGRRYGLLRETEGSRIRRIRGRTAVYICSGTTARMICSYFMYVCHSTVSAQFRNRLILECLFIRLQIP